MNKVKQFLIARACGFPSSHELISEAMNDENFIHELSVGLTITKDDLFSKTSTGKYLFEYPEVWGKLDKLNKFLADSKLEPLTGADLAQDREGGAAISHAFKCQRVMDAFTADLWKGQPAAMERAWFSLSSSASRDEQRIILKRQIIENMGQKMREDQFRDYGYNLSELRSAIGNGGKFDQLVAKLAEKGDVLRKSDLFIPDQMGDHMLDTRDAWENFEKVHAYLKKNGEDFSVSDFTFKWGTRDSPLESALNSGRPSKLFNADVWRGRLPEMLQLFGNIAEARRTNITVNHVISQLIEEECTKKLRLDRSVTKADLLRPLNDNDTYKNLNLEPVIGLGLSSTWGHIDQINDALRAKGERLTLSDLRQVSGSQKETCLLTGMRKGKVREIMDMLRATGEVLSLDDLLGKNKGGLSVVEFLGQDENIRHIFTPDQWVGREEDLAKVYAAVPDAVKKHVDIQMLVNQIKVQALRRKFASPRLAM